ncbi:hypothetical protein Hydth_1022 [Hydrogenobacter thermophilus TK-6]|uniref:Uncharacterized protein n=1 Tax=Hydrogenobacter thermophilus (strain DSM 6534 / IAM 12695 / TK-6) TaxID=608538 RepID=D3DI32_HYDTT|nr:hypothetical protein [Hydrogenobacter thermophilus]ADO45416.1 hypothetical protein Hydth_1022 [Hydrogenobacter thermophilus TK-6]BAI69484.1 hypothetical protein HTH_1026 [Hydrogenobacter thermophilus TK-6]
MIDRVERFSIKKKYILGALLVVIIAFLIDYSIGFWQSYLLKKKEELRKELENIAYFQIFPDIADINYKGDGHTYVIKFKIESIYPDTVYITNPQVTAYIQTGTVWTELPVYESNMQGQKQILELKNGTYYFYREVDIKPSIKYTEYLMPFYMHVKFNMMFFVMPKKYLDIKENIYENITTRYVDLYTYLKPYGISDEVILKKLNFPDNKVPIFIPMPPH